MVRLATVPVGGVVGEIQMIAGGTSLATVRALAASTVLVVSRATFDASCAAAPGLLAALTNLVIDRGPLHRAVRASGSIPGIALPVDTGVDLLIDGGVINNLPVDVMHQRCPGLVIAVNVSPKEDLSRPSGGLPSPWRLLWQRLRRQPEAAATPTVLSILMRTLMTASAAQTERASATRTCCCLHRSTASECSSSRKRASSPRSGIDTRSTCSHEPT